MGAESIRCPHCDAAVPADRRLCPHCATRLHTSGRVYVCDECGALSADSEPCTTCGGGVSLVEGEQLRHLPRRRKKSRPARTVDGGGFWEFLPSIYPVPPDDYQR